MTAARVRGVQAVQDAVEPDLWRYLPEQPGPERGPDGRPTVSLLPLGDGSAQLQLGARLDPPAELLEQLRAQAAASDPRLSPALVRLAPAIFDVTGIELVVTAGAEPVTVASAAGSHYPPWTAVLSARLDAGATAAVATALSGGPGRGSVRYRVVVADGTALDLTADLADWATDGVVLTLPPS